MKKLVVFLVLMAVAAIGQSVFGQTAYQKKQFNIVELEIKRIESEILKEEKRLKVESRAEESVLQRKLRMAELKTDPRRAKSTEEVATAKEEVAKLNQQMSDLKKYHNETPELVLKKDELDDLMFKRNEMLANWSSQEETLPQTITRIKKNRYQNSNVVEREELVLNKIKNNLNGAIDPAGSDGGYKVIFDNKYSLPTTFILEGLNGGERLAVSLGAKTKETHYVLPGRYQVKYVVNGRPSTKVDVLTVDGLKHFYETEPCFGFVYKSR